MDNDENKLYLNEMIMFFHRSMHLFDFYGASPLKQQSSDEYSDFVGVGFILDLQANMLLFTISLYYRIN